jgi:hypothetical protein
MSTQPQNYANHRQIVPLFHGVLFFMIVITVLCIAALMLFFFSRTFALKAQDRAIRAEENLRHFVLVGKLLPTSLTIRQVVALRFASDAEFVSLSQRAAAEGLSADDIKKSIKQWRADTYRV